MKNLKTFEGWKSDRAELEMKKSGDEIMKKAAAKKAAAKKAAEEKDDDCDDCDGCYWVPGINYHTDKFNYFI